MANYAGLSYGEEMYCGTNIQPFLTPEGQLTGKTCSSVFASGGDATLTLNGAVVTITDGNTLDLIIKTVDGTLTNACFICDCKTCSDPDGNAAKAVDVSGNTINPVSPYTLIGMGFLQN
jgi:hypothetical protein